ncbi:MAG: hypothetical protein ACFFBC_12960 [Promethearchaeota archaeon]
MRNKIIAIIILIIALSLLAVGIVHDQHTMINALYEEMAGIP